MTDQENPTPAGPGPLEAPRTGDIVIDAALGDLAGTDEGDLDAQLAAGQSLQDTLRARLADLGS